MVGTTNLSKSSVIIGLVIGLVIGSGVGYGIAPKGIDGTDVSSLNQRIENLETLTNNLQTEINSLSSEIDTLQAQVNDLQIEIDIEKAFGLLKKELAHPGSYIAEQVTNALFSELKSSNNEFQNWVVVIGETLVKNTLASIIDSKMPTLVWNNKQVVHQGDREYSVSVITYFPIEIDTGVPLIGKISVAKVSLTMSGTVDVALKTVTNIIIDSLGFE